MALSVFDDRSEPPSPAALARALGSAAPLWTRLVSEVAVRHPPIEEQWNFAGAKFGWSMRIRQGDRVVLYVTPCDGHFLVGVVLGEAAVVAAKAEGIPSAIEELLDASPKNAEGRGFRFPVRSASDVDAAIVLADAKLRTTSTPARRGRIAPARRPTRR